MPKRYLAVLVLASFVGIAYTLQAQQGPTTESSETVARPRKKTDPNSSPSDADLPKIPSKLSRKADNQPVEGPTFKSDVNTVTVDVAVLTQKGAFIPNIPRGNFRVLEDGAPQQITSFSMGEAPMTVAMVIEFSNRFQRFWSEPWYQTLTASYGFMQTLKPDDYVAVIAYDLRPEILTDFTNDKAKAYDAMRRLQIPGFSESNLFDALTDTVDRMQEIEGRKAVVLISSGIDTFSKLTFDKARRKIQEAGVPIYAIGLMQAMRIMYEQYMSPIAQMDFLQADNQMRTFAKETGGQAYFPRFYGEFPQIFQSISSALRNQYSLAYHPTNNAHDGKYRRIKVELVNPATNEPLKIIENGKPIKYQIVAKPGYNAPREVE